MYSRKYIRSPVTVTPPAATIPSGGGAPLRADEREVALPPDYTGMAFSDTRQGGALQNRRDYPETLIAPPPAEADPAEDERDLPNPQETLPAALEHSSSLDDEDGLPPPSYEEERIAPAKAEVAEAENEPSAAETRQPAMQESAPPQEILPLLTPELLRSLTLEDLLLFWMLLMLAVSSQEDQIYLLLGLLLFQR